MSPSSHVVVIGVPYLLTMTNNLKTWIRTFLEIALLVALLATGV
ncbi:MAG TPA: hypothetical protein VGF45_23785 [Polyangia bacterium]